MFSQCNLFITINSIYDLGLNVASTVTFMRFFPTLKARCDYGLSIFILTFSLISVSGYRDNEVLHMAHQRLSTIIIGSCTAIIVCISICPVWVGEELHNLVCDNIEKLGKFLEGTKHNKQYFFYYIFFLFLV